MFLASFALMVVEIVAGRVTAPYLGVSLYTWTSVIGAVLLGVTIGNYVGGHVADRRLSPTLLGSSFGLAGVSVFCVNALALWSGSRLASFSWPLPVLTSLFTIIVFFPAAFFLSMISPQIVKYELQQLDHTGSIIGTLGAWSALGSILGTFATGFFFIASVGIHRILLVVAGALIALGAIIAADRRHWTHPAV